MTSLVASLPPAAPEDPALGLAPRLPRSFLRSLRTLFEILDEQRHGAVHLSEIESRWGRGGPGLSPPGGAQHEHLPPGVLPALQQVAGPSGGFLSFPRLVAGLRIALLQDQEGEQGPGPELAETGHNSAQERPSGGQTREPRGCGSGVRGTGGVRGAQGLRVGSEGHRQSRGEPRGCESGVRGTSGAGGIPAVQRGYTILILPLGTGLGSWEAEHFFLGLQRRRARERERDALLQGLELAERLRGWYRRHLLEAQRGQEQAGAEPNYFPDSCPNQSCLLLAKIQEVNLGLRNLLARPGKADPPPCFPSSPFGAPLLQTGKQQEFQQQAVNVLKEQNRLLIKEVSEKSDRIAQLEQEKAALCRQLQESRGYRLPSHKDSTFI
ncbi:suppressor APC domain-containing protein 1 [Gopherus flavomarginatus]|uniref:suppressor APC domain-containing protein 1 n=1 Tax=Gopherus flavomarginatus TaxID=286002 RepID=UPI0021CBAF7D|nr:suppressor APC domain-containing protein 1 [Gopherus flavomarginatus]